MNLEDELESELALVLLAEKRHARRIDARDGRALIGKIKEILEPVATDNAPLEMPNPPISNSLAAG